MTPSQIKALRLRMDMSYALFAALLGYGPDQVQAWEAGTSKPAQIGAKLLEGLDKAWKRHPIRMAAKLPDFKRAAIHGGLTELFCLLCE